MKDTDLDIRQLVGVIGAERERHTTQQVAAAEEELVRRLGGSLQHARRVHKAEGALRCVLGALIALMGIAGLVAALGVAPDLLEPGHIPPAAGIVMLLAGLVLGGALCLSGAALAFGWEPGGWPGWIVRKLTRRRSTIYHRGPWPEDLVRLVADGAQSRDESRMAESLQQVRRMYRGRLKGTRRTTRVMAGLGAYAGLAGTVGAAMNVFSWLHAGAGPHIFYPPFPASAPQWLTAAWDAAAQTVLAAFFLTFPLLLAGSLGLLFLRDWGRTVLSWVLRAWMAAALVLLAGLLVALPFAASGRLFLAANAANAAVGLAFYWMLLRAVRSPRVRDLCSGRFGAAASDAGETSGPGDVE